MRGKGSVTGAEQDTYRSWVRLVRRGHVDDAVTIKIVQQNARRGACGSKVGVRLKGTVSVAEQDTNRIIVTISHHDIDFPVLIDIAERNPLRVVSCWIGRASGKVARASVQKDAHTDVVCRHDVW